MCVSADTQPVPVAYPDCDLPEQFGSHERRMCREDGHLDRDCRALPDQASCADGPNGEQYILAVSTDCMENGACRYTCMLPRTGTDAASCEAGCEFTPAIYRCDPSAMVSDPLEVARSSILKNDHGPCAACESETLELDPTACLDARWVFSPLITLDCLHFQGQCDLGMTALTVSSASHRRASIVITTSSCATTPTIFLGKLMIYISCRSGRALIESARHACRCECDNLPQLQPLFQTINSGTKDEVAAAINMTSVFVYQASVALTANSESAAAT